MTPLPITIRAEFDGNALVPLDPLDLPLRSVVDLTIQAQLSGSSEMSLATADPRAILDRIVARAGAGANLPSDALRREDIYEDR